MGRAIEQDNRLDGHDVKLDGHDVKLDLMEGVQEDQLKILNNVLERLDKLEGNNTMVHHVDLHDEMDIHEERIRKENNVVEPDEVFTPPAGKRKRTTRKARATT